MGTFIKATLLSIVLLACFYFVFIVSKNKEKKQYKRFFLIELLLIGSVVNYILYYLFYRYSGFIWSFNLVISEEEFLPLMKGYAGEKDGIEGYVLYTLMFLNIIGTYLIHQFIRFIPNKIIYLACLGISFFIFCYLFTIIGLDIPMTTVLFNGNNYLFALCIVLLLEVLVYMYNHLSAKWFWIVLLIFLFPICFIATSPIAVYDYSYVFFPAMKMIDGNPLSEIYLQYDLFLSLLAALWIKCGFTINSFQIVGQFSFFIFFIGVLFFSRQFFKNKKLAVFLFLSLLIIRYYAIGHEPVACIQVTPLRLDLWLILLLLVYIKGTYHWLAGAFLGLLLVIHKNFGLIYLISYYELIFTLFLIEIIQLKIKKEFNWMAFKNLVRQQLIVNLKNLVIILAFTVLSIILFDGFTPESAILYQKVGIGMMKIATNSIYWYLPVIFSLVFVLLLKYKNTLSSDYFSSGLLIVFLAIGNSLYFFGRSHENNILNISGLLLLVIFLLFDLLTYQQNLEDNSTKKERFKKIFISALPFLFLVSISFCYSGRTTKKLQVQSANLVKGQFIYPDKKSISEQDILTIRSITHHSKKVYFINYYTDFNYYYKGNYSPAGYYLPFGAGFIKKEMVTSLQKLLDQGYYLVTNNREAVEDLLVEIRYKNVVTKNGYTAISK